MYYEGKGLLRERNDRFIGRDSEYDSLNRIAESIFTGSTSHTGVSISGIGGIGYCQTFLNDFLS
jgi:hypothetical protein